MNETFNNLEKSLIHIRTLIEFFANPDNYALPVDVIDFNLYQENLEELQNDFANLDFDDELYNPNDRQMILADLFEYIFLGRGFYSIGNLRNNPERKEFFVRAILHFVNLLMCFETVTIDVDRRNALLDQLTETIESMEDEPGFEELRDYEEPVGLPNSATKALNKYFDKLLPKTAGGLWHELLVYIFILRHNLGYVLPLLLHQKIYSKTDHLVPPDFLVITKDKRIFGIEVGRKKEIQSGSFSLRTAIPTASVDTENSRNSDRCPICKKWILFCPVVIDKFSDFNSDISRTEIKCLGIDNQTGLRNCTVFTDEQIVNGECSYSKYSRNATQQPHTQHNHSDGKHYHYHCVLENVGGEKREEIIEAQDATAIKTHLPHYSGLESLLVNE